MKRMHTDREIRAMAVDSVEQKSELKVFENIVDKDGHKRFIEGDINLETITGVTQVYGKWSLSGSHLMIVLAVNVGENTTVAFTNLAYVSVPAWIFDKIEPLFSDIVIHKEQEAFDNDSTVVTSRAILTKRSDDTLGIVTSGFTTTNALAMRIQFDLLIDNE